MVAGYCAKEYIENGGKSGDLTIVSADDTVPYERPPLSKSYLAGKDSEDAILIETPDFYRENGIEVRLNTRVSSLDIGAKVMRTQSGEELAFEKLILATGAEVRTLDIPGVDSANVFYLRSLSDSKRIRERATQSRRAVVMGGGFIAMEVSSVLATRGIDTTMLVRDDRVWKAFFTPEISAFFEKYYTDRGVTIRKQVAAVPNETAGFDMLVAGIGVRPVTALAEQAGLTADNGIVVNEYLETSAADILAAGDVANYPDRIYDSKRRRVEHWDNAVSQGQYIAHSLLGRREPFVHVPYFFSDVFDLSYEFWGDTSQYDRVVYRGDVTTSSFSAWWLAQNKVVAAFTMNRPDEEREQAPELIRSRQPLPWT